MCEENVIAAAVSEIQALHAPSTLQIEPYWHDKGDIAKRLGREPARLYGGVRRCEAVGGFMTYALVSPLLSQRQPLLPL